MRHPQILAIVLCLVLVSAVACASDDSSDTTTSVAATTTVETTTSSEPTTTSSTTTMATTTTTMATTTTAACPDYPAIAVSDVVTGEDIEPGAYKVTWVFPNFTFTVDAPTTTFLGQRFDTMGWRPIPVPAWQHPRTPDVAFEFTYYDHLFSYDGESEIDIPDDPAEWLTQHPLLSASESVPVSIGGMEGVQVDAVVTGSHPGTSDQVRFGGYNDKQGQKWLPLGAAVRFVYTEIDANPLWLILTATEDGFADATSWSDSIVSGIEFC